MPSPKRQVIICHKIAALAYLMAEALDELNPEVKDSNPFKKQCDDMVVKCQEIVNDLFGVEQLVKTVYLQNLVDKVDTTIRKNYTIVPGTEEE